MNNKERIESMNKQDKILLQNLKGRVSKILNINNSLTRGEKHNLMVTYHVIDELLTSRHSVEETKLALGETSLRLKNSRKAYIQHHIVPLIDKISVGSWGEQNV